MSLQQGIDTVAVLSFGVYTKTYGSTDGANIAALGISRGLLESAPSPLPGWLHTINTVANAAIAAVNTVLRVNISTINET